jgi:hypothetical protein
MVLFFPVFNNEQLDDKKVHRDLKFIILVMLALILIVWKRRWLCLTFERLKTKLDNDKYTLCEIIFDDNRYLR